MNISDSNKSLFNYFEIDDSRSNYYSTYWKPTRYTEKNETVLIVKCQYLQQVRN